MPAKEVREGFGRWQDSYECKCGGYCALDEPTAEEEEKYGCDRPRCCARAFVCKRCQQRYVGRAESPEADL